MTLMENFAALCINSLCQGEFLQGFPSGEGVEGTTVPGEDPVCGRERRNPAHLWWELQLLEQWDVLLSPLSLLSSIHRDFAAVFVHRKAGFGV